MAINFLDVERISHGFKTALACLIGFLVTKLVDFHVDQWLIVTIIVVMCAQINVGSVIQKATMRFFGTIIGSLVGVLAIFIFPNNELAFAIIVAVSAMFFSYIATGESSYSDSGTLGAATVVIILVTDNPTPFTSLERFSEISLGILIAALVSQFILPIHARRHLRELQAKTLRQLRAFYIANQAPGSGVENMEKYQKLDEDIVKSLIRQRKLSNEAARELIGEEFKVIRYQQLLHAEKGILRSIVTMHHAYQKIIDRREIFSKVTYLDEFQNSVSEILEEVARSIEDKKKRKPSLQPPNFAKFKLSVTKVMQDLPKETQDYLNAFLFSTELLSMHLSTLVDLVKNIKSKNPEDLEETVI